MENTSLTDKIKMAQGFLDSAQLLERTLNQISIVAHSWFRGWPEFPMAVH